MTYQVTISSTIDVEADNEDDAKAYAAQIFDFGSADYEVREPFEEDDEIKVFLVENSFFSFIFRRCVVF